MIPAFNGSSADVTCWWVSVLTPFVKLFILVSVAEFSSSGMRKLPSCPTHFPDGELFGLLSSVPSHKTCPTWLNLSGLYTPVGTALEMTEPRKLLHYTTVQPKEVDC